MEKLLYRIPEAVEVLAIGRSRFYELMNSGEIQTIRIGKSVRVTADALRQYVEKQVSEQSAVE
jgi:excisionase family DNA binding protein